MRPITTALLLFLAAIALAEGQATTEEFNAAWGEYQEARLAGNADRTLAASGKVLELGTQFMPEDDDRLPVLVSNHATALAEAGDQQEANRHFKQSVNLVEQKHGKKSNELVPFLMAWGNASNEPREPEPAYKRYRRALDISASHDGRDSVDYASMAFTAASRLLDKSRSTSGRKFMREAFEVFDSGGEETKLFAGTALYYLGKMEFSSRQFKKAGNYLLDALDRFDADAPESKAVSLMARALLVQAYEKRNMSDEATEHCVAIGRDSMFDPNQDYQPLFRIAPRYPSDLLRAGVQGYVDLSFTVDEYGFVRDPVVVAEEAKRGHGAVVGFNTRRSHDSAVAVGTRLDRSFEAAALDAVKQFRYAPRFVDGQATAVEDVKTRITFRIE